MRLAAVAVGLGLIVSSSMAADPVVHLKSRTIAPEPSLTALDAIVDGDAPRHVLIQLHDRVSPAGRSALAAEGITLLQYVPDQTWIARVTPLGAASTATEAIRWVGVLDATDKMPRRLAEGRPGAWAMTSDGRVELRVRLHAGVDVAAARAAVSAVGAEVVRPMAIFPGLEVVLPAWRLRDLAALDIVQWVSEVPPDPVLDNDGSRAATGAEVVQSGVYGLDGTGVHVGIWDGGPVDSGHPDFAGRLTLLEGGSPSQHGTHVAGTFGGSGAASESEGGDPLQWRGMAPAVSIFSWDFGGDIAGEMEDGIGDEDLDLDTNSWGYGVDGGNCDLYGDYDFLCPEMDALVRGAGGRPASIIFSAGNERDDGDCPLVDGGYGCLNPPKAAKNTIVVGATNSDDDSMTGFSSWGPTDDGRLKPDVTAPGCEDGGEGYIRSTLPGGGYGGSGWCGTSMAAPAATGNLALLHQLYRGIHGDVNPEPSLMKALLVANAQDLGNPGPDYAFGHGRINSRASADELLDASPMTMTVSDGEVLEIPFSVPFGVFQLRVALAWDDPEASSLADPALINDLGLELVAPGGAIVHPWVLDPDDPSADAVRGEDHLNNVEHITVGGPTPGDWIARVTGTNVPEGPQVASLVGLDLAAPGMVAGFEVTGSTGSSISLAWETPSASDFTGTLVVRSDEAPGWSGPVDGTTYLAGQDLGGGSVVVYAGALSEVTDTGLAGDEDYFYQAYAFDRLRNHADAAETTGSTGSSVGVEAVDGVVPAVLRIGAPQPNPSPSMTAFDVAVPRAADVDVRIYDASGRQVRTLLHGALAAGTYRVSWDGRSSAGLEVAPGAYFAELRIGAERVTRRIVRVR